MSHLEKWTMIKKNAIQSKKSNVTMKMKMNTYNRLNKKIA